MVFSMAARLDDMPTTFMDEALENKRKKMIKMNQH